METLFGKEIFEAGPTVQDDGLRKLNECGPQLSGNGGGDLTYFIKTFGGRSKLVGDHGCQEMDHGCLCGLVPMQMAFCWCPCQ
jgi:hypothetical protein